MVMEVSNNGKAYTQTQDFYWGVLAINTNKSIYLPGEQAYLQFASLKDDGHTICDAKLRLEIRNPKHEILNLSTGDGGIKYSGECKGDNVTDVPDYYAYYQVNGPGKYEMTLTNLDTGFEITDYFEVQESVPFEIERIGPTRIYPPADYKMRIAIRANQDFKGEIIETVPMLFKIQEIVDAEQQSNADNYTKTIIWQVDWKAGQNYELNYSFNAPDVSPYLYLLGPLKIGNFQEIRRWQIASDVTCGFGTDIGGGVCRGYITSGTTWNVPSDWNSSDNSIEAIGAGGNGGIAVANTSSGGGGGGGEYRKATNVSLTASSTVDINVPSGGAGSAADGAWLKNNAGTIVVEAKNGGNASGVTAGAGGTGGTGAAANFDGGNGGAGASGDTKGAGAGGGGSAGPTGAGKSGGNGYVGLNTGGGGGGSNGGSSSAGQTPTAGAYVGGNGGNGTDGTGGGAGGTANNSNNAQAGTNGGGGGGASNATGSTPAPGAAGGVENLWDTGVGPSGGGGGGGSASGTAGTADRDGGNGGTYGGGAGGCGFSGALQAGECDGTGVGGQGIIVVTYTPTAEPNISQAHFRWRNDDNSESLATWKRPEDNADSGQARSENIRLRFSIKNTGGTASNYQFGLQVAPKGGGDCSSVASSSYETVPLSGSCGTAVACMNDSTNFTQGDPTTAQLTSEGTWVNGEMVDTASISDAITINQNYYTEVEFNFQMTEYATYGANYCFRVTNNGALLDAYTKIAELSFEGSSIINRLKGALRIKGGTRIK